MHNEIVLNELPRLVLRYGQVFGKSEAADAVNYAEVDGFCVTPLRRRNLAHGDAEDLRSGDCVDIVVVIERLDELLVAAHMSKQAKFDLRIVRAHEHATVAGDKRTLYVLCLVASCRDILKIGIG